MSSLRGQQGHPSRPRAWEHRRNGAILPRATGVIRLTRASWCLWNAFPDHATSIVHHGGRLELHRLHHIPNADLQRKRNHGGGFSSPAWLHLARGIRVLGLPPGRGLPHGVPGRGLFGRDSPKQRVMRLFLFYLIISKSERSVTWKGPVLTI